MNENGQAVSQDNRKRPEGVNHKETMDCPTNPTTLECNFISSSEIHEKSRNRLWEAFMSPEKKEKSNSNSREPSISPRDGREKTDTNQDIT